VIATADSLEDILRDYSRVNSVLVPALDKDESKIHQLPKLVDELMKAKRMRLPPTEDSKGSIRAK
jgi:hypothetical protein